MKDWRTWREEEGWERKVGRVGFRLVEEGEGIVYSGGRRGERSRGDGLLGFGIVEERGWGSWNWGSLSWRWLWGGGSDLALSREGRRIMGTVTDVCSETNDGGRSPRLTFSSINRSPTLRPRLVSSLFRLESLWLLTPLPLRLLLALILPSIIFALGGGWSIHLDSLRWVGCVLTTGGCRSFTAGFRAM